MTEHVILAAFTVDTVDAGPTSREHAERLLHAYLPDAGAVITSWWIAEDERHDGSDCDSAVFVSPGNQRKAVEILHRLHLTPECNLSQGREDGVPERWEPEEHGTFDLTLSAALDEVDTAQNDPDGSDEVTIEALCEALDAALATLTHLGVTY